MSRFDRQESLPGFVQGRLTAASVLVVGAGGLGSPVVMYLAAAGVGRVDVCDHDVVEETNIHRQILYRDGDSGPKALIASARAVRVGAASDFFTSKMGGPGGPDPSSYSVVMDCTDRWSSHDAVIGPALAAGVPVVHGSIQALLGRVIVFRRGGACWRCLHPERPEGTKQGPQGTLGPVCGVIGSMMALEALKILQGWQSLAETMSVYDGLTSRTTHFGMPERCECGKVGAP